MKPNLIIVTLSEETCQQPIRYKNEDLGSSCGSVGRAVVSNTRDPQFESSHRQYYFLSTELKGRNKKRPGMAQFLNKQHFLHVTKCRKQTYIQYNV